MWLVVGLGNPGPKYERNRHNIGYRIVEVEINYFVRIGETTLHRFDSTKWTFKRLLRSAAVGSRVRRDHAEVR